MHPPSFGLQLTFGLYAALVALAAALALGRAAGKLGPAGLGVALWLGLTGSLAASGALASFASFPPPVMRLVLLALGATVVISTSRPAGRWLERWSLAGLVAFQAFRFPLELLMHEAAREGVMPPQMTFTGRNFDILTGLLAVPVALALTRHPALGRKLAWIWNGLGLALLFNVVGVAILSVPGPFRVFMQDPPNVWIGDAPFVWLPTVLVPLALAGHILVTRRLLREP